MTATLRIAGVDVSRYTSYDVQVECGREGVSSQPDGSVLNAALSGYLNAGKVGDFITLELEQRGKLLFHGWITDLTTDTEDARTWRTSIAATGPLAALGMASVGGVDYPEESDSNRIVRVLTEAGFSHGVSNAAGPMMIARLAEQAYAADLARAVADSGAGVFWEQPADVATPLRYTPQALRTWSRYRPSWDELDPAAPWSTLTMPWRDINSEGIYVPGRPPLLNIDAANVFARVTFKQTVQDYAQSHTVTYGYEPTEVIKRDGLQHSPAILGNDGVPYELGHRYVFHTAAEVTALRLFHPTGMAAISHVLTLWDANGTALASVTTAAEIAEQWSSVALESPIRIAAGDVVTVSYHCPTFEYVYHMGVPVSVDAALCEFITATNKPSAGFPTADWITGGYAIDLSWQTPDERPTITVGAGYPHKDHETELRDELEASNFAELKLRQSQAPAWRLDRLEVSAERLSTAELDEILAALTVGTRIEVAFPLGSPVGMSWAGFLEGWKQQLVPGNHTITLQISDRSLTEPASRWADIDPAKTWSDLDTRWIDAIHLG